VSLTLGVFDLFTYAAPGAMYLALFAHIAIRLGWFDTDQVAGANTTLLLLGLLLASYVLGHVTYRLGSVLDMITGRRHQNAATEFSGRVHTAQARRLVSIHPALLLAAAEIHAKDAAIEVSRLRAVGLMLRNIAPATLFGAVTAIVECLTGTSPARTLTAAALLLAATGSLLLQSDRLRRWAVIKTYEIAYWIPQVESP
jgi:hypothetical protein